MSEIRLTSTTHYQPLAGPGAFIRGPLDAPVGTQGPSTATMCPAPVQNLLSGQTWPAPNVFEAAPLLSLQSHTAAQITNPSSTPDHPDDGLSAGQGLKGTSSANSVVRALTRATSRLGQGTKAFGSVAGLVGSAMALPSGLSEAGSSLAQAWRTGDNGDIAHAGASTATAGSTATRLVKHGIETYSLGANLLGHQVAGRAGAAAFRQAAPNASKAVVKAAARQAGKDAMKETAEKLARRGATSAATAAAKAGGTLASGAGAVGRTAAKKALQEGGEAAAKAAAKAVAKGALKTGAKAAGRFVPGLNVGIAALDTAAAAATLADPKASTGKKITSCITAAGSIVAATNIPVVSQIGAAVSTVSSFIGSFF